MGFPSARRDAAALLALRLASGELASRARDFTEFERRRRRHASQRREKLIRLGAVAVAVGVAGVLIAKAIRNHSRGPDDEPVTIEPVADEAVVEVDEPARAA